MPPTQKIGFSQLRVGIFVFLGLAVLAFLVLNATGDFNPFEKKFRLRAHFAAADGLRDAAEVQLAGVHIGKVEKVNLLPPDSPDNARVEAVLLLSRNLDGQPITDRIRQDSTAQLVAVSLLANDKMINITPGSANGAAVAENAVLNSTSTMSITQLTETGNELLQQINKLAVPANEILAKANRGEGTLGKIVNDENLYNNLDGAVGETKLTLAKLQNTIDRVNRGDGSAGKLLNDPELYNNLNNSVRQLEAISKDLRAGKGTAGKFLTDEALYNDARAAIGDLRVSAGKINAITDDLQQGKGTFGKLLKDEEFYNDARRILTRLDTTTAKVDLILDDARSGKGTLGKLLTDDALYNNVNQTAANVNQLSSESTKLIYDFRQNPKKYLTIQFKLF